MSLQEIPKSKDKNAETYNEWVSFWLPSLQSCYALVGVSVSFDTWARRYYEKKHQVKIIRQIDLFQKDEG